MILEPVLSQSHQLPVALTPFVGRAGETAQLLARLDDPTCRLVTIMGPGGAGKTRLALEVAQRLLPTNDRTSSFAQGVYFVPLAGLADDEHLDGLLATAIAGAMEMPLSGPDAPAVQLCHYLREKAVLLVLDNFEHLQGGASFVVTLLQAAGHVKLLTTSRERLNVRGEQMLFLNGLSYPAVPVPNLTASLDEYDAVQLFVQTAQAVDPDFAPTEESLPTIAQICRLLDGLPLGIELAAPWTRLLSCAEIADEIVRNLDFLAPAPHDLPARQQSLRAVFASSWSLLTEAEQQLLGRLATFRGSFSREAAAAVAGASLPVLAALVDKSLVRRLTTAAGGAARYELSHMVRQYAAEQLAAGEATTSARDHAAYYLTLLAELTTTVRGPRQQDVLRVISFEIDEIRAAWRWAATEGNTAAVARAADCLFHFYDMRSWFAEGAAAFGLVSAALATHGTQGDGGLASAKVLAREAWFIFHLGGHPEARALLERSLAILRPLDVRAELVFVLNYLAVVCSYLGEYETTRRLCGESLEISAGIDDQYGHAVACNILGQTAYDRGAYDEARRWCRRSLAIEERIGNRWSMAFSLTTLGKVAYALAAYPEAHRLFEQSLRIREETGDVRGVAMSFSRLGDSAAAVGNTAGEAQYYTESLTLFREIGDQWGIAASLLNLGRFALRQEQQPAATRIVQEALRLALEMQSVPQLKMICAAFVTLLRAAGETAWAAELMRLTEVQSTELVAYQAHAARLFAWSWPETMGGGITLAEALADVEHAAAPSVPQVPPGAEPPRGGHPAAKKTYPGGLTAREVDVLRLVAQGLTDKEVAEALILSTRTVSTHLTSIYGKLQLSSRSAATRFVMEHGLA